MNSVTPIPAQVAVSPKGLPKVTVTWAVNRTESVTTATRTVSSANAVLNVDGVLTNIGSALSKSSTLTLFQTGVITFPETLTLTAAQARAIASARPGTVVITRLFTDTQTVATGVLKVAPGFGNTGELEIRRVDLSFEKDNRTDVVHQGDTIRAVATLSYLSNGTLQGEWRVVDGAASLGTGTGRVLQKVRQSLVSSGEGRTRIISPPLPTRSSGLHLVSFSVQDTTSGIEIPVLRYFVMDGKSSDVSAPLAKIEVTKPSDDEQITSKTIFAWMPVNGASAYRLEILESDGDTLVAGKLVPGNEQSLSLTAITYTGLESGRTYDWRMIAFDKQGKTIGRSERHKLIAP